MRTSVTYSVRLVDLIFFWYSKTVVLVKHDSPDVYLLLTIYFGKSTRKRNWEMVESGHSVMRQAQGWIPEEPEETQCSRYVHRDS
jgi:hypothetical protein